MKFPERHDTDSNNNSFSSYWKSTGLNILPRYLSKDISIEESNKWAKYYLEADELGDKIALQYLISKGFKEGLQQLLNDFECFPANRHQLSPETVDLFQQ